MKNGESTKSIPTGRRLARLSGQLCIHLTGVSVVAALMAWMTIGTEHLRWIFSIHQQWGDTSLFASELALHLGVALALWTMLYLLGQALLQREPADRRVLRRARGTVITETLIVMPLILLLIMGMAQLAILNIAGMLLNYGASQAARSVWVWAPELDPINDEPARRGVDEERVRDMARIQAAAALAPVAPADYRADSATTEQFEMMRASLLSSQMVAPPNDAGRLGLDGARQLNQFAGSDRLSFWQALDSSGFPERSVRKFTFAYHAVDVELIVGLEEAGARVVYQHKIMFPVIGTVFGESGTVAGAPGLYSQMTREFVHSAQVRPNAELPTR